MAHDPDLFCETRKLAEEWTYRWLAAALTWARTEPAALVRSGAVDAGDAEAGGAGDLDPQREPSTNELRA